jgi:ribonuclease Z
MEKINITFLGTSDSIPTKKRNHTSILLNYKDENILIDCGEGTQRQFRKAHLNPCKVTRILITHWHGDHILGLPGLLQSLVLQGYNKTIEIYGPPGTKKFISLIMNMFIFVGKLQYKAHDVSNKTIMDTPEFKIETFPLKHAKYANGYSFIEKDKLRLDKSNLKKLKLPHTPLLRKLAQGKDIIMNKKKIKANTVTYTQKGRKISFVFDTGQTNTIQNKVKNSDVLISEATYMKKDTELAKKYNHLTSTQAALIAKKSKTKKLYLTHISGRYENKMPSLLKEAKKTFKSTFLAEDLQSITL